ncbi:MAG TPA: bifunctional diguanylate cyclase/phosphodiesterase [Kineosporiaceae bacterium]|nr:bifunctional diguanylate cyclase/phosphodiesterase [Kineosporiaceae bacterium]
MAEARPPAEASRPDAPVDPTPGRRGAAVRVLALAALLAAPTVVLAPQLAGRPPILPGLPLTWWALAIAFAATESVVMVIQIKREAQTVSLSELPLVLGLCFATPVQLLAGRLIGSLVVLVAVRRSSPLKTTFNLAMYGAETALAAVAFDAIARHDSAASPRLWLAAYVATYLANALSEVALAAVFAVYEGRPRPRTLARDILTTGQPTTAVVVTTALVAATSLSYSPAAAIPLTACALLLLLAYRSYARLADQHLSLERLHGFTRAVSATPEAETLLRNVLSEAKHLLHAEHAEAVFVGTDPGGLARIRLGPTGRLARLEEPVTPADHWLLSQVLHDGRPLLVPRAAKEPQARNWLAAHTLREAVAVPMPGVTGMIGVLIVGDRMGDVRAYDDSDVQLLTTVANHAGLALGSGQLAERLRHDANHDRLTGLPNRPSLQRHLAAALQVLDDGAGPGIAVLLMDLDQFKEVNDALGPEQGDRLLVDVAGRLARFAGPDRYVARLGGDEYAVAAPAGTPDDALHLARQLLQCLEPPFELSGLRVPVRASLGIALAPDHADDVGTLLRLAHQAMYEAKTSGRSLCLYRPGPDGPHPTRLALISDLRSTLEHHALDIHVQPQARLTDDRVIGVEVLARWHHPAHGSVSPDEFIPLAERHGLIPELTAQILDQGLAACRQWRSAGEDLAVAVNLSASSLNDPDLIHLVVDALGRHQIPSTRLTLEVTESSVMTDPARAICVLHQLRDLGIRLSVDDFGTGYSSLSYLKQLPVHEVKIDRAFVGGLGHGGDDLAIVQAIVDLGHHLGLTVVAEGAEDAAAWDLLRTIGCDLVQGWYLSRPMPPDNLLPWLTSRRTNATGPGLR